MKIDTRFVSSRGSGYHWTQFLRPDEKLNQGSTKMTNCLLNQEKKGCYSNADRFTKIIYHFVNNKEK